MAEASQWLVALPTRAHCPDAVVGDVALAPKPSSLRHGRIAFALFLRCGHVSASALNRYQGRTGCKGVLQWKRTRT